MKRLWIISHEKLLVNPGMVFYASNGRKVCSADNVSWVDRFATQAVT